MYCIGSGYDFDGIAWPSNIFVGIDYKKQEKKS